MPNPQLLYCWQSASAVGSDGHAWPLSVDHRDPFHRRDIGNRASDTFAVSPELRVRLFEQVRRGLAECRVLKQSPLGIRRWIRCAGSPPFDIGFRASLAGFVNTEFY